MSKFLDQAKHNEALVAFIATKPANTHLDWQMTVVFYAALHYLIALAGHKRVYLGNSHKETLNNLDVAGTNPTMPVSSNCFNAYRDLLNTSYSARYQALYYDLSIPLKISLVTIQLQNAHNNLAVIKAYIQTQGLAI